MQGGFDSVHVGQQALPFWMKPGLHFAGGQVVGLTRQAAMQGGLDQPHVGQQALPVST